MRVCFMILLVVVSATATAAERRVRVAASSHCRSTSSQAAVRLETGLTVVPFAVPVAVPVAVVSQPAALYAYRADISGQWSVVSGQQEEAADAQTTEETSVDAAAEQLATDHRPLTTDSQLRAAAVGLLQTRCAACHTGENAKGELRMFGDDGAIAERLPRRAMLDAVEASKMPQGEAPLTDEELDLLREWAKPPRDLAY